MKKFLKILLIFSFVLVLTSCAVTAGGSKYSFDDSGDYDEEEAKNDDFTINGGEDDIEFPGNYDPENDEKPEEVTPEEYEENLEEISDGVCSVYVKNDNRASGHWQNF